MKHESKNNLARKIQLICQTSMNGRVPLACSTVLLCLATGQALAQTAADTTQKTDEIVVTGSRIRGVAAVGSNVVSVGRDEIEASGATTTAQVLQQIPQVFNLGVTESSRGTNGGAGNITYGSSVNIRGIGPFATLALINGHRAVPQGTTAASVDPSILPTLALERLEVVADGASAIYGSDAVAGVANMIMRRNVDGGQLMVRYGTADGYNERQIGGLWGKKWAGGQVTLTVEHDYHTHLSGVDRDFFRGDLTSRGGGNFASTQCNPGTIVISGTNYPIPAGGVTSANASQLVSSTATAAARCDNLQYQDLLPRQERNSGAFTFDQDLGHGFKLYADGFFSRREYRFIPGYLASNLTVPSANPFYVRPPGAPAGTSETVAYSFINDLPQNVAKGFSRSGEATVGVDYALPRDWKVGVLYTYGQNEDLATSYNGLNNTAIAAALADTNRATALNVFSSGANNPATLAAISNNISLAPGKTKFDNVQLKGDGPLMDLPGGKLRAAFGFENQHITLVGGQTSGAATAPLVNEVHLGRTINSAYAEFLIPVFGSGNAIPGLRKLELDIAGRIDDYSDVGSTRNPKFGLNWSPVDGLTIRSSYGRSFRAPGLTNLRSVANQGLFVQNYSDPTLGGAIRQGVALNGGYPGLTPETATTKSLGFDWAVPWGNQTKLSVNYFDVRYENQLNSVLSDLTILGREGQFDGTGIIVRNPSASLYSQYPVLSGVLPNPVTLFVDGRTRNLGKSITHGFDLQASTRIQTNDWGNFGIGINGTIFTKYKVAVTPAAPLVDQLNTINNPLRFKARASGSWSYGPWYSNLFVNYTNAYQNNLATPIQKVSSNTTVDVRVAYSLDEEGKSEIFKDATIALGATNLFDKEPPFVNIQQSGNGGGGFDPTVANPIGRVISITFDKRF